MRNLKRVLALALALVMMLGMMITASAASYSDAAAIDEDYAEAVEILSGMGIFKGQGTGFAPKATLTRAEAAAIIYRVITADVKDSKIDLYDYAAFADTVEGAWYNGYVTYAANGGYIKGYDGNFMPNDSVTGIQVLAILLRAIGYGQNGEFEGAAWKDNVLTSAHDAGMLDGVDVKSLDIPATREIVAQLIWNGINANMVTYTPALGYLTTVLTGTTTLGIKNFDLASTKDYDAWGRPATVWYAETNNTTGKQVTEKLYASIADKAIYTSTVAVDGCTLLSALGYAETNDTLVTFNTYTNGKGTGHTATVQSCHNNPALCLAKQHTYGAQGRLMEVYKENPVTNTYRVVYIDTFLAKIGLTTKAANTHTPIDSVALTVYETNNTGVAYNYTYATGTEAYTKDAYALVNIADGVVKTVTEIAPAATAKGAYWLNTAAGETTIVGGVTYNDACKFFVGQNIWDATKTWNVYTDAYGNIIGLIEYVAPNTYAYGVITHMKWVDTNDLLNSGYVLSNIVKMDATTMANTILADNTLTTGNVFSSNGATAGDYDTDKVSETTQYNSAAYGDTLFQYTLNPNGSYNITNKASVVSGTENIKAGVADLFVGTDGNYMATNDNTVYLVKTGTAAAPVYTTYVGYKNVPSMNGVSVQFMKAALANGVYSDYVYVNAIGATYDGQAGYVWFTKDLEETDAIGYNATGDKAYLAYIDGKLTPVYVDKDSEDAVMTSINGWDLYAVTRNADGDITSATRWTNTAIADVTGITGTVITNGQVDGTFNCTGATVYAYAADGSSVTVVPEAQWSSVVVGKTAYVKDLNNDGMLDIIYVQAGAANP